MAKYRVTSYTKIQIKTIVEASSENEAVEIANNSEREIDICVHGTEDDDAEFCWVFVDAPDMVDAESSELITKL